MSQATPLMRGDQVLWILEDDPESMFVYREIFELRYPFFEFSKLAELKEGLLAVKAKERERPRVLIADLRVVDGNFLPFLAAESSVVLAGVPILVVSSCDDIDVLRECFNEGVMDYIVKPFTKSELVVKIERLVGRGSDPAMARSDTMKFVPESLTLERGSDVIAHLTARELQVFSILYRAKGTAVSRSDLQESVWKSTKVGCKTLDVHLFNLRRKLEPAGCQISFVPPDSYALSGDRMDCKL